VDITALYYFLGACDPKAWILFLMVMALWFFFYFCKHTPLNYTSQLKLQQLKQADR